MIEAPIVDIVGVFSPMSTIASDLNANAEAVLLYFDHGVFPLRLLLSIMRTVVCDGSDLSGVENVHPGSPECRELVTVVVGITLLMA